MEQVVIKHIIKIKQFMNNLLKEKIMSLLGIKWLNHL